MPIQLPIGSEDRFEGVIDLIEMKAILYRDDLGSKIDVVEIPEALRADAAKQREQMIEVVAEADDTLTHKYLEGEALTDGRDPPRPPPRHAPDRSSCPCSPARRSRTRASSRCSTRSSSSCRRRSTSRRPSASSPGTDQELVRTVDDKEPCPGLVFKIATDPFVGHLAFFRVYSGTLKAGSYVLNSAKGKKERVGRALEMHANHREEIAEVYAGDIGAIVGLKDTYTGDTLCDPDHPILLETITFPEPVIEVKVEPRTKADQDKMGIALQRLAEEDPTFRVHTDPESGETLIAGMGELHLDVIVDRMVREFKVAANVGKPQVSYRETIRRAAEGNGRFVRQTGGKGQYGHVVLTAEPGEKGAGYEFVDKIVGGTIPREYMRADQQGIAEALEDRHLRRLPDGRREGHRPRRLVPRGRLVGDGVQDRRARWPSRMPSRRRARSCSSR